MNDEAALHVRVAEKRKRPVQELAALSASSRRSRIRLRPAASRGPPEIVDQRPALRQVAEEFAVLRGQDFTRPERTMFAPPG